MQKHTALLSLLALGLFTSLASVTAHAAPAECSLPVCDLPKALAEFKAAGQQARYQTILGHLATANRSTDADVLNNLIAFSDGAKQVLVETQDAFWMVNAAVNLGVTCDVRLAKYAPLEADTLLTFFKNLPYEANRYEVLLYWQAKSKDYELKSDLLELSKFFSNAKALSTAQEDDEYVTAVAKAAESSVNAKIFRLQPIYEGVFSAKVTCETGGATCAPAQIDRLVILDPLADVLPGEETLFVSLVIAGRGVSLHTFADVKLSNGGRTLEGISRNSGTNSVAKLHLDFDLNTRDVVGYVETTDSRFTITAKNSMPLTPIALFDRAQPVAEPIANSAFDRAFRGTFGGMGADLKINIFESESGKEDAVGATLTLDAIPNYRIHFQAGRFFPRRGLLVMTGQPGVTGGTMKLVLQAKRGPKGLELSGLTFSTLNGNVNAIQMKQQ